MPKEFSRRTEFDNIRDFNPAHIFECGQCFRWLPSEDSAEGGRQVWIGASGSYAAEISYEDGRLIIDSTGGDKEFWYEYFDLATDYGKIKDDLIKNEPRMKEPCEYGCGIRILNQDLFETLISFIISQNNNIPRIRKNIEALCDAYGEPIGIFGGRTLHAFPTPEALAAADVCELAELRLGYRCEYIKESSAAYLEGGAPKTREEMLEMHGVGPKVANCIMLFGLHDVAAFPIDTWVKYIMHDMYGFDEGDVKGMQRFARDKFGGYAGYAQQYLFHYYREKGKEAGE